ncbi:MAG: hypothetical protein RL291_1418 [Pseudomonadota bacterium]
MAQRVDGFDEPDDWLSPEAGVTGPLPQTPLTDEIRIACLRLVRTDGVGPVTFRELINRFGGADAAIDALPDLARQSGRKRIPKVPPKDVAERELEEAARHKLTPLFTIEPGYPPLLAHIPPAPPPLIYVRGQIDILTRPMLAIVGSRDSSAAGQRFARHIAEELGQAGYVIASGLARGIDRVAHEASLATGTVAVLAGGLDRIYPPEHEDLAARIAEQGCLVSEMPPGFEPRGQDFPRRNRIISGMARGVLIVEAARRSGTLTTARLATEQGREVFAVPGHPLDPRAEGVNQLLKNGAKLTTEAADILSELGSFDRPLPVAQPAAQDAPAPRPKARPTPAAPSSQTLSTEAAAVLEALGPHPTTIDELIRATGLSAQAVNIALITLAMDDRIERHGQGLVSRREGRN